MVAGLTAARERNTLCSAPMSTKFPADTLPRPWSRQLSHTETTRSGAGIGSGRSTTALSALKMAVVAPIPRASVATATSANPLLAIICRTENAASWRSSEKCCATRIRYSC